mmetsp:Transcript_6349/g.14640  ORF Transcript_6349/g.14640 Transcript_6349/m.14640 type:complete len:97 (+) Transcript_6349:47-337(+)
MSMISSAIFASLIVMKPEAALACSSILLYCLYRIYAHGKRIFAKFRFEEDEASSFDDILSAPLVEVFTRDGYRTAPTKGHEELKDRGIVGGFPGIV